MVDGVILTIIKSLVLASVLMGFFAYMTWVERKLIGRFQARYGPNRVGPYGLMQPIADLGKMLQKENMIPDGARPAAGPLVRGRVRAAPHSDRRRRRSGR